MSKAASLDAGEVGMLGPVARGQAQLSASWQLHPYPPGPGFLLLWDCVVSQRTAWCLAALVTASLLPSGLRSTDGPQGFPLSEKSSLPPTEEGEGGRQVSLRAGREAANKACFQSCLLVFIFPWALPWEEQRKK